MSLVPYRVTAIKKTDPTGNNVLPFASVSIIKHGGGFAQLWDDEDGTTARSNPFTVDANGERQVWLNGGGYSVTVSGGQSWDIKLTGGSDILSIDNVAALSSITAEDGRTYQLKEYHDGTGRGGGILIGATGPFTANGITVFAGASGTHFRRLNVTNKYPELGGAYGDLTHDDTVAVQRVLDLRGEQSWESQGYLISDTLKIYDNTNLKISPTCKIKQANGINKSLLVNSALKAPWATITGNVFWTAGTMRVLITWPAHGLIVGDAVYLDCESTSVYNGVFTVIKVDNANDFHIRLRALPVTNPVGAVRIKRANVNIKVSGGKFDWDVANNTSGTQSPDLLAIYFSGVRNLEVENMEVMNTKKYGFCVQGVLDYKFKNIRGYALQSDLLKIYGPAFNGHVENANGYPGDDMISMQTREPAQFVAYQIGTGGDIRGLEINGRMDQGDLALGVMCSIYPAGWGASIIDNVKLTDFSGYCENTVFQVYDQEGSGGRIGKLTIENCDTKAAGLIVTTVKPAVTGPLIIDELNISLGGSFGCLSGGDIVQIGANTEVGALNFMDTSISKNSTIIGNSPLLNLAGDAKSINFSNFNYSVNAPYLLTGATATKNLESISFVNSNIDVAVLILRLDALTFTAVPNITTTGGSFKAVNFCDVSDSILYANNGSRLNTSGVVFNVYGATSPVLTITSNVGLISGEWAAVTGNARVSPKSFDIVIDIQDTICTRENGNRATAITGRGAIPGGSLCFTDPVGGSLNWHALTNPTVEEY